jgi:hypothetical protein
MFTKWPYRCILLYEKSAVLPYYNVSIVFVLDDNLIQLSDIREEICNLRSRNAQEASKEVSVLYSFFVCNLIPYPL